MTPYALRRRMAHGNIYPLREDRCRPVATTSARATSARSASWRSLWMADRVDEALQDYMKDHGIEGPWETRERILVGVSGRPEDETLIRRAARMARATRRRPHRRARDPRGRSGGTARARRRPGRSFETLGGIFHEVVGTGHPGGAPRRRPRRERDADRDRGESTIHAGGSSSAGSVDQPDHPRIGSDRRPRHLAGHRRRAGDESGRSRPPGSDRAPSHRRIAVVARGRLPLLTVLLTASSASGSTLPSVMLLYLTRRGRDRGARWALAGRRHRASPPRSSIELVLHAADPHVDDRGGGERARDPRVRRRRGAW